jgi:hypothetical protein
MDPLSDVIALLRPSTAISKPITGRGRWGVRYAAHDAPGFTIILKGVCWVTFEGREPLKLIPPAYADYAGPIFEGFARPAMTTKETDVAEAVWAAGPLSGPLRLSCERPTATPVGVRFGSWKRLRIRHTISYRHCTSDDIRQQSADQRRRRQML